MGATGPALAHPRCLVQSADMRTTLRLLASVILVCGALQAPSGAQGPTVTALTGMRLITGDTSPSIPQATLVMRGDTIIAVGPASRIRIPTGATRVDLSGKTVMPALIDGHTHLGFTNVATMETSAGTYSSAMLRDHLTRYAYYGLAATLSLGADAGDAGFQVRNAPTAGTALFRLAGRGIASPGSGPQAAHNRDTPHNVTTEAEARAAVREEAAKKVDVIKIWVDDRGGSARKLTPALYTAIINEAHRHGLRVVAHIFALEDAKGLLKAGIDGFAHGIRDTAVDADVLALFKARPQVFVMPNLPDTGDPIDLDWAADSLPVAERQRLAAEQAGRKPEAIAAMKAAFAIQARNLVALQAAGVRIGFGTDAGASVGWTAHQELADMVTAGMTPAQVLVAATSTSASILRLPRQGTLRAGQRADLLVLDANPLDDIQHTRRIASVYLRGQLVDRTALRATWATHDSTRGTRGTR